MLINWIQNTKSESDLFLYTKYLWSKHLKPVLENQIVFWVCVLVLWIQKDYCVIKKLVWNVHIKASGIQRILKWLADN